MKILIYGFDLYKGKKKNITREIVRKIPRKKNIFIHIFPAKFKKEIFINKIKKIKPDVVIGLGQGEGKKIKIERKASNVKEINGKLKIIKKKPKHYLTNLRLKKDKSSTISYDAGKYVCNFSMYIISDFIKDKNTKFAFLHIPYNYNLKKATRLVLKIIKKWQ